MHFRAIDGPKFDLVARQQAHLHPLNLLKILHELRGPFLNAGPAQEAWGDHRGRLDSVQPGVAGMEKPKRVSEPAPAGRIELR